MIKLEQLIEKKLTRRDLLKSTGKAAVFFAAGSVIPNEFFSLKLPNREMYVSNEIPFKPISPSKEDNLILPEGFKYEIIRKWGDNVTDKSKFGYNNDYVAYLPIDLLEGGNNSNDGLLAVNHEYPSPLFINNYTSEDFSKGKRKSLIEINEEKKSVGISIFRVKRENGKWTFVNDDKYNRRIDANTRFVISGYASGSEETKFKKRAMGTLANCSGCITPWGTLLSAEENFEDYFSSKNKWEYRWNDFDKNFIIEHYGWIVEVDPFNKIPLPAKRTSLGRFRHENVAIAVSPDKKIVAYMGDDKEDECVYKFISKNSYNDKDRISNMEILNDGELYVADFNNNKWQLLNYNKNDVLKKNFKSQADVLINCDKAAKLAGGTPCNRPEDIEVNPVDNSVFVAFTNNTDRDDYHGSIVRILEKENNPESLEFEWEVFLTGGVTSGFSCPDNLTFDSKGNLWVMSDISKSRLNKDRHASFKNNAIFMIPTSGENKGKAFQFASAPVDSELCGGNFTPDESTMFISIQHPGEGSKSIDNPTSRWPDYGNELPKPAVVAITGFNW